MKTNLKRCVWVLAISVGIGAGTVAIAAPSFQDKEQQQQHEQDYSKNKTYQQGMREGRDDQSRSRDHYKNMKRHFKKDDDNGA